MEIKINLEKLDEIMHAFYSITGIKIIVFDENRNYLHSYPKNDCAFCTKMKSTAHGLSKCVENDKRFFNESRKAGKLMLYTCHAGLVEGCAPIAYNGVDVAYIMFGQISDLPTRYALNQNISDVCRRYSIDEKDFLRVAKSIKLKKYNDIMSAAKIFEACVSYIILNEMLVPRHDRIISESERYITENLENVTVTSLCEKLNISRTKLYEIFRHNLGMGVSSYIRAKRFEQARRLLTDGKMTVKDVSDACGFTDYNYFSRSFKKAYGVSPRILKK